MKFGCDIFLCVLIFRCNSFCSTTRIVERKQAPISVLWTVSAQYSHKIDPRAQESARKTTRSAERLGVTFLQSLLQTGETETRKARVSVSISDECDFVLHRRQNKAPPFEACFVLTCTDNPIEMSEKRLSGQVQY